MLPLDLRSPIIRIRQSGRPIVLSTKHLVAFTIWRPNGKRETAIGLQKRRGRPAAALFARERSSPATTTRLPTALLNHYSEVRGQFAAAVLAGGMSGIVFGHAAFSRAAGFDGKFSKLVSEARQGKK